MENVEQHRAGGGDDRSVAGQERDESGNEALTEVERPYHHGDLPAALLAAVAELIREGGLGAVTLRAAARRAGVSHAAPAHHFGDKSGMIAAFARQGFDRFATQLRDARDATDGPPSQELAALALAYLAFAREHRPWFEVMFRPELIGAHADEVAEHGSGSFQVLLDQVNACFEEGTSEEEVLGMALSAWASVHGLAQLLVDGPLEKMDLAPPDMMAGAVLATVIRAFRAHPGWVGDTAYEEDGAVRDADTT